MRFSIPILLVFVPPACARDAAELLSQGNVAYRRGEHARAIAAYEACLELEPERSEPSEGADAVYVPCLINLASVLVDLGPEHHERAEQLYRVALAANPDDGDAAFNLASLLHDRKSEAAAAEAVQLYQTAIDAEPARWDAWANMAAALQELKQEPLRAINAFERAILLLESSGGEAGGTRAEDAASAEVSDQTSNAK